MTTDLELHLVKSDFALFFAKIQVVVCIIGNQFVLQAKFMCSWRLLFLWCV
jgi:hypothetical protein